MKMNMRKLSIWILMLTAPCALAATIVIPSQGVQWVINGKVVISGAGAIPPAPALWVDTYSNFIEFIFYTDDQQMQIAIETHTGNITDTDILPAGAESDTEMMRYEGLRRGYYLPQGADKVYAANTNIAGVAGTNLTSATIGCWFDADGAPSGWGLISVGDLDNSAGVLGMVSTGDDYRFSVDGSLVNTSFQIDGGEVFFAMVWDGTNVVAFENIVPIQTNAMSGDVDITDMKAVFGAAFGPDNVWKGTIKAPFYVFNRFLTTNTLQTVYDAGAAGFSTDLVGTNGLVCYPMTNDLIRVSSPILQAPRKTYDMWPLVNHANTYTMGVIAGTNGEGRVKKVLSADGVDDSGLVSSSFVPTYPTTNDWMWSVWVYFNDLSDGGIMGYNPNGNDSAGLMMSAGDLLFRIKVAASTKVSILSDTNVTTGQWYHVACIHDFGGASAMYVDGVRQAVTPTNTTALNVSGQSFVFNTASFGKPSMFMTTPVFYMNTADTNAPMERRINTQMPNGDIEDRIIQQ